MSRRYRGAVISATAPTITNSRGSGFWTLRQNFQNITTQWPVETLISSPILYFSFYQTVNLDSRIAITRNTSATYFDDQGTIITVGTDTPRFDHDPATGENLGLLVESASTNVCLRSEEFQTVWTTDNTSVTINTLDSLDEVTAADSVLETATTGTHSINQNISIDSTTANFSFSVFVKSINRRYGYIKMSTLVNGNQSVTCEFDLIDKTTSVSTVGTASQISSRIIECRNGWFRVACSGKTSQTGSHVFSLGIRNDSGSSSYLGETSKGFYAWGYQVEQKDASTSYIKTTTEPISRSADVIEVGSNNFSSWFNPAEGTILFRGVPYNSLSSSSQNLFEISDSTANETIALIVDHTSSPTNKIKYSIKDGSVEQSNIISTTSIEDGKEYRISLRYKVNDLLMSVNGTVFSADASAALPTVNRLRLGSGNSGNFDGHIKEFQYWNTVLNEEVTRIISTTSYDDPRSLILEFRSMEQLDSRVSFSRNSPATYYNKSGILATASTNQARLDHKPNTLENLGLLIEESRTNFILRSEEISDVYWTKSNVTVTANDSVAPDGNSTADLILEEATNSAHQIVRAESIDSITTVITISAFVKPAGRSKGSLVLNASNNYFSADFDLDNISVTRSSSGTGQDLDSSIKMLPNGWFRISVTGITGQNATTSFILRLNDDDVNLTYLGDITKGMYMWGMQLEQGGTLTSYIKTTDSTSTRESDIATLDGVNFSDWFNPSEGSFYWQGSLDTLSRSNNQVAFTISDGTADEKISVFANFKPTANENKISKLIVTDNSTDQVNINSPSALTNSFPGTSYKISIGYKTNDFSISLDNNSDTLDTAGTLPIVDKLNIGSDQTGSNLLNGHVSRLYYWNTKRPEWFLKTLKKKI
jgi:hypothetical protein